MDCQVTTSNAIIYSCHLRKIFLVAMDQADDDIKANVNASEVLLRNTSIDTAYVVYGLLSYSSQTDHLRLPQSTTSTSPRLPQAGWYTSKDSFIPNSAIACEQALFKQVAEHFEAQGRATIFRYNDAGGVRHQLDRYIHAAAAKTTGGTYDLVELNKKLTLPPLIR
jgi:hypothetical protein